MHGKKAREKEREHFELSQDAKSWGQSFGRVWDIPAIQARAGADIPRDFPILDGRSDIIISVTWTLREWCSYVFFTPSRSLWDRIHTPSRRLRDGVGILARSCRMVY